MPILTWKWEEIRKKSCSRVGTLAGKREREQNKNPTLRLGGGVRRCPRWGDSGNAVGKPRLPLVETTRQWPRELKGFPCCKRPFDPAAACCAPVTDSPSVVLCSKSRWRLEGGNASARLSPSSPSPWMVLQGRMLKAGTCKSIPIKTVLGALQRWGIYYASLLCSLKKPHIENFLLYKVVIGIKGLFSGHQFPSAVWARMLKFIPCCVKNSSCIMFS